MSIEDKKENAGDSRVESSKELKTVPFIEKLDQKSKEFVTKIKALSEMSEAEYLLSHPEVAVTRELSEQYFASGKSQSLLGELAEFFGPGYIFPGFLKDRERGIGTMWDVVQLHLLEMQDFLESKTPGFHSPRTRHLIDKVFENMRDPDVLAGMPDAYARTRDKIARLSPDADSEEKLKYIEIFLNMLHQYNARNLPMPSLRYIKDLWRYIAESVNKLKSRNGKPKDWDFYANQFWQGLGNINIKNLE